MRCLLSTSLALPKGPYASGTKFWVFPKRQTLHINFCLHIFAQLTMIVLSVSERSRCGTIFCRVNVRAQSSWITILLHERMCQSCRLDWKTSTALRIWWVKDLRKCVADMIWLENSSHHELSTSALRLCSNTLIECAHNGASDSQME